MLTYADICLQLQAASETVRMLTYADVCRRMPTYADLKFSPDGRLLATTSADGSLDVYDSQVCDTLTYADVC